MTDSPIDDIKHISGKTFPSVILPFETFILPLSLPPIGFKPSFKKKSNSASLFSH